MDCILDGGHNPDSLDGLSSGSVYSPIQVPMAHLDARGNSSTKLH